MKKMLYVINGIIFIFSLYMLFKNMEVFSVLLLGSTLLNFVYFFIVDKKK